VEKEKRRKREETHTVLKPPLKGVGKGNRLKKSMKGIVRSPPRSSGEKRKSNLCALFL